MLVGKFQNTLRNARASSEPCNRWIKHGEGLAKCPAGVLTANLDEAHLTRVSGEKIFMQSVFVVDTDKSPQAPIHPAEARKLLSAGKAAIWRHYPFTIILKEKRGEAPTTCMVKIDPGSRTTGLAIVDGFGRVVWGAEFQHRGQQVRDALLSRRSLRRSRRHRKTRYRPARFNNRRKPTGWLPPSLESRIANITTWVKRLRQLCPVTSLAMELVKFDTQALVNPEIKGLEYQQGALVGYEVREYLLEKWSHKCAYCGATDVPLQVEHILPKSRGGGDRVSNLTLACGPCNQRKGNQTAAEFGFPHLHLHAQRPLKDAAAVNATRWALYRRLQASGLPIEVGTGGRTKYNRTKLGLPKAHWIDAACVGESGAGVQVDISLKSAVIRATGHNSRQMCRMDKHGFPRTGPKQARRVKGFRTGDLVKAIVPTGKNVGTHIGRVAVRASGSFRIGKVDGVAARYCQRLHHADGYDYLTKGAVVPPSDGGVSSRRSKRREETPNNL